MNTRFIGALVAFVFSASAGSLSAATKEQLQMMADLRMLQEQSQQLQILLGSLSESLKAVNARLEQRIDQQSEASRKAFADQKLVVDTLAADLRVVREKVDDSNVRIGSLSQEVDALRQSVVTMSIAPATPAPGTSTVPTTPASPSGSPAASATTPAAPAPPAATPPAAVPIAPGTSPQRLWDMAFAEYSGGRFDLAVMGFEAYIKSFPKSDMADEAQVYICSSHLNTGDYQRAADACDMAIRTYPNGNALPEAYFRKGVALQRLQQFEPAGAAFEHVVKSYPDTIAAIQAKQRLESLKQP